MDLFTYLMAKNGNNSSVHGDLFSYLLGKGQSQIYTVSGVTIYIPNAKKLVSFMMTKESTQDGEPTPDNPVEVKVVEGYENLFDKENIQWYRNNNSSFSSIANTSTNRIRTNSFAIVGGKTYTLSGIPSGITLQQVRGYSEYNETHNSELDAKVNGNTFTLKNEVNYIHLLFSGENFTDETNELMANANICIAEGTEEKPYVPYGNNYVNVNITEENIFDNTITPLVRNEYTNYSVLNDNITISSNGGSNSGILWNIPVTQGKNITISYDSMNETTSNVRNYVFYYFSNNPVTRFDYGQNSINKNKKSVTITTTDNYLILGLRGSNNNSYTLSGLKVGYPSIVSLPLNGNEIAGIGNYLDEYIVDKNGHCWLNKKTGKVVLDGLESNWKIQTIESVGHRFYNTNFFTNSVDNQGLCNYMQLGVYAERNDNPGNINNLFYIGDNNIQFRRDNITTLVDFKSWLTTLYNNGNPVIVYYASRKPQLIDLNTTVDLKLFKGANTITNSEDGYMTIEYR